MMPLRIKTKLSLGLGFLFAVIILIGSLGATYIHRIARESKDVLKDNYESVQYARAMLQALDAPADARPAMITRLEKNLVLQEHNVTETGEQELTEQIRSEFKLWNAGQLRSPERFRALLYGLMDLNMQAIVRKNTQVQNTADHVLTYIGIIGGICFIIVFTFIINFPGYIANPIRELTESIRQIAARNYRQRLHFKSDDEFGDLAAAFNVMAEKLDQYENSNLARIMFEKRRIETIINNMKDAIIGLNEQKTILFANAQATQLLSLQEKDLVGKYAPDVALRNDLLRILLTGDASQETLKIVTEGKENYYTRESIAITSDDKAIGDVILLRNITRFQELDQAKTNFIATISHELKTPIASIKLSSKLLEDNRVGTLNEEQKQLIGHIKDESERLLKITGEVLNMAQVETGRIQLNIQPVNPAEVVKYAVEALKFQAGQKQVELSQKVPALLPQVYADPEKTAWVLINLLSNAIRYSPAQSEVTIAVLENADALEFSVKDAGPGIDMQYQARIFDKFFRVPGSHAGTGLGLAIAKEFITAQSGTIRMESEPGKGTRFMFTLPIMRS